MKDAFARRRAMNDFVSIIRSYEEVLEEGTIEELQSALTEAKNLLQVIFDGFVESGIEFEIEINEE